MLSTILLFLLKVILGAVVVYIIAAFIVSLKRLLPILSILSSVGLIVLLYFVGGKEEYLFLVVVLALFNQLCFQGEGFFEEHIVENAYRVVSVERRWNSLFADFDDYKIYVAPKYIGGFFENTLFMGILFIGYYYLFGGSDLQYVIPIYVILRSIVDLIYIFIYQPCGFFTWAINVLCVLFSFLLSVYIVPETNTEVKLSYKDLEECIVLDYSKSYKANYHEYILIEGYKKDSKTSLYFTYDSYIKAGGYCHSSQIINNDNPYQRIVYNDVRYNDELVQFKMNDEYKYDFETNAKEIGDLYKYDTAEGFVEDLDYSSYLQFSKEKYDNMVISIYSKETVTIKYTCEISDDNKYTVYYELNWNNRRKPTSLKSIRATIYTTVNRYHEVSYTPIYEEPNDKYGPLSNTSLQDRFYTDYDYYYEDNEYPGYGPNEGTIFLKGHEYKEPEKEKETYGINFNEILYELEGKEDVIANYDFTLEWVTYGGDPYVYAYDSSSNKVAYYFNSNYENYKNAIENNAFDEYLPNSIIYNDLYCVYSIDNGYGVSNGETFYESDEFIKYTVDDVNNNLVITKAFNYTEILEEPDYRFENNEVKVVFSASNSQTSDSHVTYAFYFENITGSYKPYKVEVSSSKGNRNYFLTMYYNEKVSITF